MVILNDTAPKGNIPEFSVSELSGAIKRALEGGFPHVRVRAECSRITVAKSGHVYLDLKDDSAVLSAIIWAGTARTLNTQPKEGMEIIATGRITTFAGQSKYQLIIERLEPAGIGAILAKLEETKKRLASEGLFEAARKRPIPFLPQTIGIITSPTGAVIRDILHRLTDRFPRHVLLWRVLVQGDKAAGQIVEAIKGFNAIDGKNVPRPDVIIVARGGGSIEDLWAFNEEIVVRAVAASEIPIISAIGHETDTTLIDYAADLRAPTPTGAAEMAVPVRSELMARIANIEGRLKSAMLGRGEKSRLSLNALIAKFPKSGDIFASQKQKLDIIELRLLPALHGNFNRAQLAFQKLGARFSPTLLSAGLCLNQQKIVAFSQRIEFAFKSKIQKETREIKQNREILNAKYLALRNAILNHIHKTKTKVESVCRLLNSLSYERTLERGYSIVFSNDGKILKDKDVALLQSQVKIRMANGEILANPVKKTDKQGDLFN